MSAITAAKLRKESARYRRQVREVESERDTLAGQLDTARRALVDRMAADNRIKPAALWSQVSGPADLADDDGNIDPDKVSAAAEQAASELGLVRTPKPDKNQGRDANAIVGNMFEQGFKPR